ncbi:MAG: hypothetical protein M3525_04285 [Acidobacteriota bacterium]|nr:hypothetical protein [Acidobacteriota bacterium]
MQIKTGTCYYKFMRIEMEISIMKLKSERSERGHPARIERAKARTIYFNQTMCLDKLKLRRSQSDVCGQDDRAPGAGRYIYAV